jgi:hypothetical protein
MGGDCLLTLVTALPSASSGSVKAVEFSLFGQPFTAMSVGPLV